MSARRWRCAVGAAGLPHGIRPEPEARIDLTCKVDSHGGIGPGSGVEQMDLVHLGQKSRRVADHGVDGLLHPAQHPPVCRFEIFDARRFALPEAPHTVCRLR